jgi:hypothetical protein
MGRERTHIFIIGLCAVTLMTYTPVCKNCKTSFESVRKGRVFCSPDCQVTYMRSLAKEKPSPSAENFKNFYLAQHQGVADYQLELKRIKKEEQLERDRIYKEKEPERAIQAALQKETDDINYVLKCYRENMRHPYYVLKEKPELEKELLTAWKYYVKNEADAEFVAMLITKELGQASDTHKKNRLRDGVA